MLKMYNLIILHVRSHVHLFNVPQMLVRVRVNIHVPVPHVHVEIINLFNIKIFYFHETTELLCI